MTTSPLALSQNRTSADSASDDDFSWNPCLRSDIRFKSLPTEIVLRILSYLGPHDLVQSASCCREWYNIASDPILWRTLDLSLLHSTSFNPRTATALTSRLRSCRTFILNKPDNLTTPHITALLHFLASSPRLRDLKLTNLGHRLNPHSLEHHFRNSQSRCLTVVDLAGSNVTTPAVVAMMDRHRNTIQSLDLSNTSIGDGTLRSVSSARSLHTLHISNCKSISRTSIRNFLTKRFPACITMVSLRGLKEVKITWLYDLLRLPTSSGLKFLDVSGCERLTLGDLKGLIKVAGEKLEILHDAKEPLCLSGPGEDIWAYRRYIEFLGEEPRLADRLAAGEAGKDAGAVPAGDSKKAPIVEKALLPSPPTPISRSSPAAVTA